MLVFLQQPIVVDVAQQPAETARITYSEVILSAFGLAGGIMVTAALVLLSAIFMALGLRTFDKRAVS